jgi:hypothetical protein
MGIQFFLHEISPKNNRFLFRSGRFSPCFHFRKEISFSRLFYCREGSWRKEVSKVKVEGVSEIQQALFSGGERGEGPAEVIQAPGKGNGRRVLSGRFSGGGTIPGLKIIAPLQGRPMKPESPLAIKPWGRDNLLLPGGGPADSGRGLAPGSNRDFHFRNLSTRMTITTARIRRTIKPPYIRKFMNFFPKLIFSFPFSGVAVSCTGLLVASMAFSFYVSICLFT